jgi:hypothetical protein
MSTRLSPSQVEQLKRRAKELRRAGSSLGQLDALNQVARENGWPNWALLAKNSLPWADDHVTLECRQFPGGMDGVLLVDMTIAEGELRKAVGSSSPSFDLPKRSGWLFRGAGPRQHEFIPYIDLRHGDPRGVFVEGRWRAILSINGIQLPETQAHMAATLPGVLRDLKVSAFAGLLPYIAGTAATAGGQVRLFFSRPGESGVAEIAERAYASVAEAKAAELPDGWVRIGIPLSDGKWLTHQLPFGWSE